MGSITPPNFLYSKEGNDLVFRAGSLELFRSPVIAIVYAEIPGRFILYKHGPVDLVHAWHDRAVKIWTPLNMATDLRLIEGSWPADDLNNMVHTPGFLEAFLKPTLTNQFVV